MSSPKRSSLCRVSDSGNALLSPPRTAVASVGQWRAITAVLLTSFFSGTANAQQAPVEYRIERIPVASTSSLNDINNLSMVVGYHDPNGSGLRVGYVYDHLGIIGDPKTVHLLNQWIPNLDGWSEASCYGINDKGQIVGVLRNTDDNTNVGKGFYLDLDILSASPTPTWQYLPTPPNSSYFYGRRINYAGDVIVPFRQDDTYRAYLFNPNNFDPTDPTTDYEVLSDPGSGTPLLLDNSNVNINDFRQVAGTLKGGTVFRLTPGVQLESIPFAYSPNTINDSGTVAGTFRAEVPSDKGKRTRRVNVAARFDMQGDLQVLTDRLEDSYSIDINHSGDVVMLTYQNGRLDVPYVYHSEANGNAGHGLFNLDDLVFGDADDIAFWFEARAITCQAMNNRDATGFGQIAVNAWVQTTTGKGKHRVTTTEYRKFLLTPVLTP